MAYERRTFEKPEDFYGVYDQHRAYGPPDLKKKHIRQYDEQFWVPAACHASMGVLEIGCGSGTFLNYLRHKGVERILGLELDPLVKDHMPDDLAERVRIVDIWDFLESAALEPFEQIVMLDVLEHFSPYEGVRLLHGLRNLLTEDGSVTVRVPNVSSPWGLQYQFHDLTHKAAYTPGSLRQVALAAGFDCDGCLPQRRGNRLKRLLEDITHGLLRRVLTEPPEIWSANMVAVLKKIP